MSQTRQRRGRGGGKRRRAREMAVQMLYQQEQGSSRLDDVFATFDVADYLSEIEADSGERDSEADRKRADESFEHARALVRGTLEDGERIDDLIRAHAENWRLERMPAIDRNILRLAVYEMLHEKSVPQVVIVDEAIELAKKFGAESSGRFVNGLLDGVLKSSKVESRGGRRPKGARKPKAPGLEKAPTGGSHST